MPSEGSRIPPAGTAISEIGQASPREQNMRPIMSPSPSGRRRYFADSTDIEAAIDRLAQLLAADTNGPRTEVPRGY